MKPISDHILYLLKYEGPEEEGDDCVILFFS